MDNIFFERVDMAEWFPGATDHYLRALDRDSLELEAEIILTADEFWSLPGDTFEEDELEDENILARILTEYSERQGD